MIIKRLTQSGNSKAIVIDKALLQAAGLDENALFQIVINPNGGILIQSVQTTNENLVKSAFRNVVKKKSRVAEKIKRQMIFLTLEQVIAFHAEIINEFGGAQGIREMSLLISALEMPKAAIFGEYLHASIEDKAAAYLYYIICNHPFVDGNKRTGLVTALTFLEVNEIVLTFDDKELEELVVQVAAGQVDKQVISDFFRKHRQ